MRASMYACMPRLPKTESIEDFKARMLRETEEHEQQLKQNGEQNGHTDSDDLDNSTSRSRD